MGDLTKVYIINLKDRIGKKNYMLEQLKNLDNTFDVEFFEAVDGNKLDETSEYKFNVLESWYDPITNRSLTKGEVGCALSHYTIWQKMVENNIENAIIFEDDIGIPIDFASTFNKLKSELPVDYDLFYLHRQQRTKNEKSYSENLNVANYSYWLCAYMISNNCAKNLINTIYSNNLIPVDEYVPIMCDVNYPYKQYSEIYKNYNKMIAYAPKNSFMTLNTNGISDTVHTLSYKKIEYYEFNTNDKFTALLLATDKNQSDSYNRFVKYCNTYGVPFKVIDSLHEYLETLDNKENILISYTDNLNTLYIDNPINIVNEFLNIGNRDCVLKSGNNLMGYADILYRNEFVQIENNNIFCEVNSANVNTINKKTAKILYGENKYMNVVENNINLAKFCSYQYQHFIKLDNYPTINIIFILYSTDTLVKECLKFIDIVDYPADKLNITIFATKYYDACQKYPTIINSDVNKLYNYITNYKDQSEYTLVISNQAVINNKDLIKELLQANVTWASPMIKKFDTVFSNFWGDLDENGYYKRSINYIDIVSRKEISLWNVPYVNGIYLFNNKVYDICPDIFDSVNGLDLDMSICKKLRDNNIFMYVLNNYDYGVLLNTDNVKLTDLLNKREAWEYKYLHFDFLQFIRNGNDLVNKELCKDAFQFPIFTKEFAKDLIEMAENDGNWSKGGDEHYDKRINNKEPYPTKDIHLNQLNFDKEWYYIVDNYIRKVASHLYSNYKTKGPHISFVVRYKSDEQVSLAPHHDASTYTINVALNEGYEGGGCRFLRQDCTVRGNPTGHACIHPGRLTHYHEGLPVTDGIRYILVSFIN